MIFFWQRGRDAIFRNNCTEWFIDIVENASKENPWGIYHSDLMLFSFRPTSVSVYLSKWSKFRDEYFTWQKIG